MCQLCRCQFTQSWLRGKQESVQKQFEDLAWFPSQCQNHLHMMIYFHRSQSFHLHSKMFKSFMIWKYVMLKLFKINMHTYYRLYGYNVNISECRFKTFPLTISSEFLWRIFSFNFSLANRRLAMFGHMRHRKHFA